MDFSGAGTEDESRRTRVARREPGRDGIAETAVVSPFEVVVSAKSAAFASLVPLAFMLVLYFGASPASSARFGMWYFAGTGLAHAVVWRIAERRR